MSSKETADKLVDRFMNISKVKLSDYSRIEYPTAKQCALIAVDEIIKTHTHTTEYPMVIAVHEYWDEVKQEIEKL